MAQKRNDANVLYLNKSDLNPNESRVDIHNVKRTDLKFEVLEDFKKAEIVIFSTAGVLPQLMKSRW